MAIPLPAATNQEINLKHIFALQPEARNLWLEAVGYGMANPSFDNEDIFHRSFKNRVGSLVGFHSPETLPASIRSSEAYEILYRAVLDALHCWATYQDFWDRGVQNKYKPGWASIQFKIKYGVMPNFRTKRRFAVMANSKDGGLRRRGASGETGQPSCCGETMADSNSINGRGRIGALQGENREKTGDDCGSIPDSDNPGLEEQRRTISAQPKHKAVERCCRWSPEPGVGRVAHGIPRRVDRLKSLGNAIVPQVAYEILKNILEGGA